MNEEKKAIKEARTKVEIQVLPCIRKGIPDHGASRPMNHEQQDDPCAGIILSVTCDGSKLTKADAGRSAGFNEEVFVTAKITPGEFGKLPIVEMTVSEKCHGFVKSEVLSMPDALNANDHGNA